MEKISSGAIFRQISFPDSQPEILVPLGVTGGPSMDTRKFHWCYQKIQRKIKVNRKTEIQNNIILAYKERFMCKSNKLLTKCWKMFKPSS